MSATLDDFLARVAPARIPDFKSSEVQRAYAHDIEAALRDHRGQFNFIEGDAGIGKTIAYLVALTEWLVEDTADKPRRVVIATHSRALQQQLVTDANQTLLDTFAAYLNRRSPRMAIRMGRGNYLSAPRLKLALECHDLAVAAADTQRPDAERALARWALDSDGCLANLADADLPAGVDKSAICVMPHDPLPEAIAATFEAAANADILVTNHALLVQDLVADHGLVMGHDDSVETALVIDEGEHAPATAAEMLAESLSLSAVSQTAHQLGFKANQTHADAALAQLTDTGQAGHAAPVGATQRACLEKSLRAIKRAPVSDPDVSADHYRWSLLREAALQILPKLVSGDEHIAVAYSPVRGLPRLVASRAAAGRIFQRYASTRTTILTSATLSDITDAAHGAPRFNFIGGGLCLAADSPLIGLRARHQAVHFGTMTFRLNIAPCQPLQQANDEGYELVPTYAQHVAREAASHPSGRTLLLCASYADVRRIVDRFPPSDLPRLTWHGPGQNLDAIARALPANGILLTPAGWEGLSPARDGAPFWSRIVIVRNPRPPINESYQLILANDLKARYGMRDQLASQKSRQILSATAHTMALHKLRQGLGRGIRHPDDRVEVVIVDPRFPHDGRLNHGQLAGLAAAIPPRFQDAFRACALAFESTNQPANAETRHRTNIVI
ncbi:helicase C-terminal domain-containing protein [Salinisphaera orenii]|uniref:helicase C-terminal domain-containing protein n=1 Tax=Salinisphaera orenii TaxID=856731 RepID=UPI000DBE32D9